MKTLENKLFEATKELKESYLSSVETWAKTEFERLINWADDYTNGKLGFGEASKIYNRLPVEITNPQKRNVGKFVEKELEKAEKHYINSTQKLANRIIKKGLNPEKIKIEEASIDENISAIITDGEKTIRAFTIIASGEVQRPHYRYLIK